MSDLISRSALLEKIQFRIPNDRVLTDIVDSCVKITRRIIEEAPAVDAVEVVRCKDCKHWNCYGGENHNNGDCSELYGMGCCMNGDDFCSYGERKGNATD